MLALWALQQLNFRIQIKKKKKKNFHTNLSNSISENIEEGTVTWRSMNTAN